MALSLLLMLTLLSAALYSARIAAGRVGLSVGLEEGMYSYFGQYDRTLFRKYGLMFVDGGYGQGALQPLKVSNEIKSNASYAVQPKKNTVSIAKDVLGVKELSAQLEGYILATDQNGAPFCRQVTEAMEGKLGKDALSALLSGLSGEYDRMETFEEQKEAARIEEADQSYDDMRSGKLDTAAADEEGAGASDTGNAGSTLSEEKKNLIETLRKLRTRGVLSLVLPSEGDVSSYAMDSASLLSQRSLQTGLNLVATSSSGADQKLMMIAFLTEMFPCYTSQDEEVPMRYQMEYAVAGKSTDAENLKSVCEKLLAAREAANLAFLLANPAKTAEADELALAICSAFGHPELQILVALALKSGWAFAESILDVRELLSGGKIALVKTEDSWQLDIDSLPYVLSDADSLRHSSSNGLSYKNYLRLFLLTKSQTALTKSAMDLTEWNVRQSEGKAGFQLDSCIDTLDVILSGKLGGQELAVRELYGYGDS